MSQIFGEQHQALVEWLADGWWRDGPPVAAVQGFPGNGKTEVALRAIEQFRKASPNVPVLLFDCPKSSTSLIDDLVLILADELNAVGDTEMVEAIDKGIEPATILRRILSRPRLIVIDEAQRLMSAQDGRLKADIARLLEDIARTADPKGRLLLLSSREVTDSRIVERISATTLRPFKPAEAQAYLSNLLAMHDQVNAIPANRLGDVVQWLGGNARALRLLVSALARDNLDFLIGLAPETWEARDREVSPGLLRAFEESVLIRAEEQLDDGTKLFLRRIAVLRKPFSRNSLEALATGDIRMEASRDELLARYIIEFRSGRYYTHPVVRDTVLNSSSDRQRRAAHMAAGAYFARAFQAKKMTGPPEALGARFVEARYHFTLGESEADLLAIATRFEGHLRSQYSFSSRTPTDRQELAERIGLLSALLKDRGPHSLEYHLARCLLARGNPNDNRLALPHLRRSTGPQSPYDAWLLRVRVEAQVHGVAEAVRVGREGIELLPTAQVGPLILATAEVLAEAERPDEAMVLLRKGIEVVPPPNLSSLYQMAGGILAGAGKTDEAVHLLREGIDVVSPTQSLFSLYQAAAAVLANAGKAEEAIALLREGIDRIPPAQSLFSLYQTAGVILDGAGRSDEAVALLREGIDIIPPAHNLFSLYQTAGVILDGAGRSDEAVALLRKGIDIIPPAHNLFSLYQTAGVILDGAGRSDEAVALLREGIDIIPPAYNLVSLYLTAGGILTGAGRAEEAVALLLEGADVVPPAQSLFSLYQVGGEILARSGAIDRATAFLGAGQARLSQTVNNYKLQEAAILMAADFDRFDLLDALDVRNRFSQLLLGIVRCIVAQDYANGAAMAEAARDNMPDYLLITVQGMFAAMAAGDNDCARRLLRAYHLRRPSTTKGSLGWLSGLLEFLDGNFEASRTHLSAFLGKAFTGEPSLKTFVALWKASCDEFGSQLSYHFPRLPPRLTGLDYLLVRNEVLLDGVISGPKPPAHVVSQVTPTDDAPKQEVKGKVSALFVATEWSSEHGGLSTFNRQLCIAVAAGGLNAICLVPQASEQEKQAAAADGVTLVEAVATPGQDDLQRLMRKPRALGDLQPDFIVGHGRITGPAAEALAADHYPASRRLHFVHMAPDDIEAHKPNRLDNAGVRAQARTELEEDLGRTAHRLVAVGPRLHGRYATLLAGYEEAPPPLRFDPGFDGGDAKLRDPPPGDPWQVLVLGRAEDARLKGIDIAAAALQTVAAERRNRRLADIQLVVRGVPPEEMANLRESLIDPSDPSALDLVLRTFTTSNARLQADMRRASLVLMPSRSEGFGLVGLEAIVAGTPLLVSRDSGLGQLLNELLTPEQVARVVIDMWGDDQAVKARWAAKIGQALADREAYFKLAQQIREWMSSQRTWGRSVKKLLDDLGIGHD